jgi:hypothetical protein
MTDLAEHIGVVFWVLSGVLFICGILIGLLWNDLRKKVEEIKKEARKFSEWLLTTGERGGRLVTEKLYFDWCKEQQSNCQACESYRLLMDWRNLMNEKGGPMLKNEHSVFCKEITKEVAESFRKTLEEMLKHNQQLTAKEFELLRVEIKNRTI